MSTLPTDPAELDAIAAEYVLGTLDARTSRAVEQALASNRVLADSVQAWEATFAPLAALAPPEAPPPELWSRIEQALAPTSVPRRRGSWVQGLWRAWAIGASFAAIALAALVMQSRPEAPQMMSVLVSDPTQTAWTAEVDRRGALQLAALSGPGGTPNDTAPSDGRVLELWGQPPGATAPTSLGLVPRGSGRVSIPQPAVRPVAGMLIMISLEQPGGAPGGKPTGPVLFIGRLSEAGPPT
jgi:anti-sigma-K factor RskA